MGEDFFSCQICGNPTSDYRCEQCDCCGESYCYDCGSDMAKIHNTHPKKDDREEYELLCCDNCCKDNKHYKQTTFEERLKQDGKNEIKKAILNIYTSCKTKKLFMIMKYVNSL